MQHLIRDSVVLLVGYLITSGALESVDAILDELVPLATRGKFVIGEFEDVICLPADDCRGTSLTYEKVTIYYNAAPETPCVLCRCYVERQDNPSGTVGDGHLPASG